MSETPNPTSKAVPLGHVSSAVLEYFEGAFRAGYNIGRERRSEKPNAELKSRVVAFIESSAKMLGATSWAPASNPADAVAETAYQEDAAALADVEQETAFARQGQRQRHEQRAQLGPRPVAPGTFWGAIVVVVAALAFSLAGTMHDAFIARIVPDWPDERRFIASYMVSLLLAGALTWGILAGIKHVYGVWLSVVTTGIGVACGVAIYLLRPEGRRDSIAWSVLEVALVLLLEVYATGQRVLWHAYEKKAAAFDVAQELAKVADSRVVDAVAREQALRGRIAAFRRDIKDREHLVQSAPRIAEAAKEAGLLGLEAAIHANRAEVLGATVTEPSKAEIRSQLGTLASVAQLGHSVD